MDSPCKCKDTSKRGEMQIYSERSLHKSNSEENLILFVIWPTNISLELRKRWLCCKMSALWCTSGDVIIYIEFIFQASVAHL